MKKTSSFLLIYVFFSSVVFFIFCLADQVLIENSCKRIAEDDPNLNCDFCISALGSEPSSKNASLNELGVIAFKLAISNAAAIRSHIMELLEDDQFDHFAKICLQDCLELYSDAKSSLHDGLRDFRSKDYRSANIEVSAAMDASTTCDEGFGEKAGEAHPLTKENNDFFQLTVIAIAFTNMFH
ncbi:hypothetical protein Ancab_015651 [Ancistrocladus abbreviatus]